MQTTICNALIRIPLCHICMHLCALYGMCTVDIHSHCWMWRFIANSIAFDIRLWVVHSIEFSHDAWNIIHVHSSSIMNTCIKGCIVRKFACILHLHAFHILPSHCDVQRITMHLSFVASLRITQHFDRILSRQHLSAWRIGTYCKIQPHDPTSVSQ